MTDPHLSGPYVMAKAGYDVWVGNNRGNKYSRKHQHIDPDKNHKIFFNFSFETLGKYDVPAMIEYELQVTGR